MHCGRSDRRVERRRRDLGRSAQEAAAFRRGQAEVRATMAVQDPPGSLRREALAYCWLLDRRRGLGVEHIARTAGVTVGRVRSEIYRARRMEPPAEPVSQLERMPWLKPVPIFPVNALTPRSPCPHRGPLPEGSRLYCPVCHSTGYDQVAIPPAPPRRPGGQ